MPTNIYDKWTIGEVYSFSSVVPAILPDTYQRMTLMSFGSFEAAKIMAGSDIYSQWRQIYPHLPDNTPDAPQMSAWYIFKPIDQQQLVALAEQWIDGSTVTVNSFVNWGIIITESDYQAQVRIRDILNQLGTKFQIVQNITAP